MLPFEEAIALTVASTPRLGTESVPLSRAAGRVLAEPISADSDVPPFDVSAMDGWAVRAADLAAGPAPLRVRGAIRAGSVADGVLPQGEAWKVMTGAPIPEGADSVVPVEAARPEGDGSVFLEVPPRKGAHVRSRAEVFRAGSSLLEPGRRLTPADVAVAAAAGRGEVAVVRRPRVVVLVTGDEIVPSAERPGPGQIRDTNGPLLLSALARLGISADRLLAADDERDVLRTLLDGVRKDEPDFLLTSGGISAGDHDLVEEVLTSIGARIVFHRVAIRPAKPILLAVLGTTVVLGLPGNPVSAAVGFDLFFRTALRAASGISPALQPPVSVESAAPLRNRGNRLAFVPAVVTTASGRCVAWPLESKGSHDLLAHARANALLELAPRTETPAGTLVPAHLGDGTASFG